MILIKIRVMFSLTDFRDRHGRSWHRIRKDVWNFINRFISFLDFSFDIIISLFIIFAVTYVVYTSIRNQYQNHMIQSKIQILNGKFFIFKLIYCVLIRMNRNRNDMLDKSKQGVHLIKFKRLSIIIQAYLIFPNSQSLCL